MIEWYTAIRAAKLNRLAIAYPSAQMDEVSTYVFTYAQHTLLPSLAVVVVVVVVVVSAQQRICYSALCAIARPSHRWISQRWLKIGSCNLHRRVAP